MPTYLCLQRSLPTTADDAPDGGPSPAQMQEIYAAFGAWQQRFADQLVDLGGRLGDGTVVATADGPFVEVKELVGGSRARAALPLILRGRFRTRGAGMSDVFWLSDGGV